MADGIYSALSGALSRSRQVDMLSHNMANQSTSGYREFRVAFEEASSVSTTKELGFSSLTPSVMDVRAGEIVPTDEPLDLALTEGVYMSVLDGGEEAYTRGGSLMVRPDGLLVDTYGRSVLGKDGPARVPPGTHDVTLGTNGEISGDGVALDSLRLVQFSDEAALRSVADGVFRKPDGVQVSVATSKQPVMAGYKEGSNFDVLKGITDLITAQRGYEATLKAVETFSHINKRAANDVAKI